MSRKLARDTGWPPQALTPQLDVNTTHLIGTLLVNQGRQLIVSRLPLNGWPATMSDRSRPSPIMSTRFIFDEAQVIVVIAIGLYESDIAPGPAVQGQSRID